ncbi:MAG: histidine phosphatase family protein [Myxococcota bacterium]|nr:histidine phosphatase family protein [Myxococcota bacterium]
MLVLVRHGESTANELNVFAGNNDVPLTAFGRAQASVAGRRIDALGVRFDEVHTSRLSRALETAQLLAREAPRGIGAHTRWCTNVSVLDERDFGAFTQRHKNLAARAVGFFEFEAMMHEPERAPPDGESSGALHARVKLYYDTVLEPARRAGKNVLVVAHKYVLEALVLVAACRTPGESFDMKVPNSTPIVFEDLPRFATGGRRKLQKVGDYITAHCIELAVVAALAGTGARALIGEAIGAPYLALMIALLTGAAFFGSIDVDLRQAMRERGSGHVAAVAGQWLLRMVVGGLFLALAGPTWAILGAFFVTPPATATATLARSWAGDGRRAGLETVVASILLPVLAAGAAITGALPAGVPLIALTAACACIVAGNLAGQIVRAVAKTRAPAFALRFGWIGPLIFITMALLGAYQLSPLSASMDIGDIAWPFAGFVVARLVIGALTEIALSGASEVDRQDARIAHQNPNVFLWSVLAAAAVGGAVGFAGLAAFLTCLLAENWIRIRRERRHLRGRRTSRTEIVRDPLTA